MSHSFYFKISPERCDLAESARREPDNFFLTPACAEGYSRLGFKPVLLGQTCDGEPRTTCLGFLRIGRLTKSLEVPWIIGSQADAAFWQDLTAHCRKNRIWRLSVRVIGDTSMIEWLGGVIMEQVSGAQHRLQLLEKLRPVSENHQRSLKKAIRAGLVLRESSEPEAIRTHCQMMEQSMKRRSERGENVPSEFREEYYHGMLGAGAGTFFQTVLNDDVVSSLFVLLSERGAYYQSAGTSTAGMNSGAAVFTIVNTANRLAERGITVFDLGGVEKGNEGLDRFKSGFGSEVSNFEEVTVSLAPAWVKKMLTAAALLRNDPGSLLRHLLFVDKSLVFETTPDSCSTGCSVPDGIQFRKLTDECLNTYCAAGSEMERQRERFMELGYNDAYGAFLGDELAHVSWLVSAAHDVCSPIRDVKLRPGEMEITHCQTARAYRGKGIYPAMIRFLTEQARLAGVRRLFMVTDPLNEASKKGILKGGLHACGTITRIRCPFVFGEKAARFRGYRARLRG